METETRNFVQTEYSHLKSLFFNAAYFGPSPLSAQESVGKALSRQLDPSFYEYNDWMSISERLRQKMANLLEVSADTIAHFTSSSDVINKVANGFQFHSGDHVAAIDKDYPSNILPWMLLAERKDVVFDRFSLGDQLYPTANWLKDKLHPKTKIFTMSWVTFDTGKKMDLVSIGKMLKERDILFVVDATQGLGGLNLSKDELRVIDVVTCSTYKWMLGPYGHAFAYFSEEAQKKILHTEAHWISSPNSKIVYNLLDYTTETLPGARKYDRGQAGNFLHSACLESSLDFFQKLSFTSIEKYNASVRDFFVNNFPKNKYDLITPKEAMGNIVCVRAKGIDSVQLEHDLKLHNVDVSVRQGNIRISFHVFIEKSHVEKLIGLFDAAK